MKKYTPIIYLCWAIALTATAQTKTSLEIIAKNKNGAVVLRWVPTEAQTWLDGNQLGYRLERITYDRDNKNLVPEERKSLLSGTEKRFTKADWEQLATTDQYAKMAMGLLYYDDTDTSDQQEQLDVRLLFSAFAAGMSAQVAEAAQLGFTDNTARPNERYYYELSINYPDEAKRKASLVKIYQDLQINFPEPRPQDLMVADFTDSTAVLKWNTGKNGDFVAFHLEQSDDGGVSYYRQIKEPILHSSGQADSDEMMIQTKVATLHKNYYYRVIGLTPFGDESPASTPTKLYAYQTKLPPPDNVAYFPVASNKVMLRWTFPDSLKTNIKGFEIWRGQAGMKMPEKRNSKTLDKYTQNWVDSIAVNTAFYQIVALDLRDNKLFSVPIMVELIDSIPPLKPANLQGKSDKKGVVKLTWDKSSAPDFLGYQILNADDPKEEFLLVNKNKLSDTLYTDTLVLSNASPYTYYIVLAHDTHLNRSKQNDTLRVKRPDMIPPLPPNLKKKTITDTLLTFEWEPSLSPDVIKYELTRVELPDTAQKILQVFDTKTPLLFIDSTFAEDRQYQYRLLAYDDAGLPSDSALSTIGITIAKPKFRNPIKTLRAEAQGTSILLSWTYTGKQAVKNYELHRRIGENAPLVYYKSLGKENTFKEEALQTQTLYGYRLVAYFEDGTETSLSNEARAKTKK